MILCNQCNSNTIIIIQTLELGDEDPKRTFQLIGINETGLLEQVKTEQLQFDQLRILCDVMAMDASSSWLLRSSFNSTAKINDQASAQ